MNEFQNKQIFQASFYLPSITAFKEKNREFKEDIVLV